MLKEFLQFISPYLISYPKIKIDFKTSQIVDNCVLKHLKVDNIYKLKDIYEGNSYYESFKIRTFSEVAVEKILNINYIDWNKKELYKKYKPLLNIGDNKIEVIGAEYGQLPFINKDCLKEVIICLVALDRTVSVCGYINLETENIQYLKSNNVVLKGLGKFISFDKIIPFNNLEELKIAINGK